MAATTVDVLDRRDADALTRSMAVLDDVGRAQGAPGLFVVVSDSGRSYLVNEENGACECDDSFYRDPEGGCIHYRRLQYATGEREIPDWVNHDRVDPQLGQYVHEEGQR